MVLVCVRLRKGFEDDATAQLHGESCTVGREGEERCKYDSCVRVQNEARTWDRGGVDAFEARETGAGDEGDERG